MEDGQKMRSGAIVGNVTGICALSHILVEDERCNLRYVLLINQGISESGRRGQNVGRSRRDQNGAGRREVAVAVDRRRAWGFVSPHF